jgi:hypothetical protein
MSNLSIRYLKLKFEPFLWQIEAILTQTELLLCKSGGIIGFSLEKLLKQPLKAKRAILASNRRKGADTPPEGNHP